MSVDLSRTAIETMRAHHSDKPGLKWIVADVCALPNSSFPDASFSAVIDKGTLDSLLCGEGSTTTAAKYVMTVSRVLQRGGVFLIVSYGAPDNRLRWVWGASRARQCLTRGIGSCDHAYIVHSL